MNFIKKIVFIFIFFYLRKSQKQCSWLQDFGGNVYNPSSLIQTSFNNLNLNLYIESTTNMYLIFQKSENSIYYYIFKMQNNRENYFTFVEFNEKKNLIDNFLITTDLQKIEKIFKIKVNENNQIKCENMKCIFSQKCKNEPNCQNCPNCQSCSRNNFSLQNCEYIPNVGNPVKLIELMMINWHEWFNPEKNFDLNIIFEKQTNGKIFYIFQMDRDNRTDFMVVDYSFEDNQVGELFVTLNFKKINEVFNLNLNLENGNKFYCPKLKCSFFDTCDKDQNNNKIASEIKKQDSTVNKLNFADRIKKNDNFLTKNNSFNTNEINSGGQSSIKDEINYGGQSFNTNEINSRGQSSNTVEINSGGQSYNTNEINSGRQSSYTNKINSGGQSSNTNEFPNSNRFNFISEINNKDQKSKSENQKKKKNL